MIRSYSCYAVLFVSLIMSGCAKPVVVSPVTEADRAKNCTQIMAEIKDAERYQKNARAEDKFKVGYIAILPAIVSVYNMNKAEDAANLRQEGLRKLAKDKGCK